VTKPKLADLRIISCNLIIKQALGESLQLPSAPFIVLPKRTLPRGLIRFHLKPDVLQFAWNLANLRSRKAFDSHLKGSSVSS
jgi:hypothetical protein